MEVKLTEEKIENGAKAAYDTNCEVQPEWHAMSNMERRYWTDRVKNVAPFFQMRSEAEPPTEDELRNILSGFNGFCRSTMEVLREGVTNFCKARADEIKALKEENLRLSSRQFKCIFCGFQYQNVEDLKDHSQYCEKHPLYEENARLNAAQEDEQTIKERDELEDRLTNLAEAVGDYFEVPVGEWSNCNDPDKVAIAIIGGEYKTKYDRDAQVFTLDQVRKACVEEWNAVCADRVIARLTAKPKTPEERVLVIPNGPGWAVTLDGDHIYGFGKPSERGDAEIYREGLILRVKKNEGTRKESI